MKYGLSFLPDADPGVKSARSYYEEAIELCVRAEGAGLHAVKMTQHYGHAYGGYCPSPLMFLSAVAARTKTIRLMTGCILPVFHHPVHIAAEIAMLDSLSGGRVDAGFGRGFLPYEFEAFGVPLDESRERYEDTIDAVRRLWRGGTASMQSRFF